MSNPESSAFESVRYDKGGQIRSMATADGYLMCRRPGCHPFVMSAKEWNALYRQPTPDGDWIVEIRRRANGN